MSVLGDLLFEKAETVMEMKTLRDVKPSCITKDKVLKKLKEIDNNFYKELIKKSNVFFSFGDKFFAPVNDIYFICIPKDAKEHDIWHLLPNNSDALQKEIIQNYRKMHHLLEGYFDIS